MNDNQIRILLTKVGNNSERFYALGYPSNVMLYKIPNQFGAKLQNSQREVLHTAL